MTERPRDRLIRLIMQSDMEPKSFAEICRRTGFAQASISTSIRRRGRISDNMAEKFAAVLGVEPQEVEPLYGKPQKGQAERWSYFASKISLCWKCDNAIPYENGYCPWSESFEPVPGWVADKSKTHKNGYRVLECPLYTKSEKPIDNL